MLDCQGQLCWLLFWHPWCPSPSFLLFQQFFIHSAQFWARISLEQHTVLLAEPAAEQAECRDHFLYFQMHWSLWVKQVRDGFTSGRQKREGCSELYLQLKPEACSAFAGAFWGVTGECEHSPSLFPCVYLWIHLCPAPHNKEHFDVEFLRLCNSCASEHLTFGVVMAFLCRNCFYKCSLRPHCSWCCKHWGVFPHATMVCVSKSCFSLFKA